MLDDLKKDATTRMAKCVQTFAADTRKLRTGRAHPSLVENLKVDYYGTATPLSGVASLSVPEPRLIVIKPWEKPMLKEIEEDDAALFTEIAYRPPIWVHLVIWMPMTVVVCLGLLRPFKGAMLAAQFMNKASQARRDE